MHKHNFIGSVFMVSGCAMGAGCIAMPMLAAGPNFVFSSIFLILVAAFSYKLASVSLEIFLLYKNEVNISTIVKNNFGHYGVLFTALINSVLMYALLSVYITGGTDLLSKTVFPLINIHLNEQQSLIVFLAIVIPVFLMGANLLIRSNKVIFYIKLIAFVVTIIAGITFLSSHLLVIVLEQLKYIPRALPMFLGALWFHFTIPVIAKINNYDRKRCRQIFLVGLILPLILYIMWVAIMLSLIPRDGIGNTFLNLLTKHESVGTMIKFAISNHSNIPNIMKISLNTFSNVALLTSFLTVGLSTYDYIRDTFKIKQTVQGIICNLFITILPPSIFTLFFPNKFIFIYQQTNILLMITNTIVLACLLKEYNRLDNKPSKTLIYILLLILTSLITCQVLDNFGLLPDYGIS